MSKTTKDKSAERAQKRVELEEWCREHLKPGRHFGTIHKKVGARDQARWCNNYGKNTWGPCDDCSALPALRQPGAERICDYLGVLIGPPELARDVVEASGGNGWCAFRIALTDKATGEVVGHGIGACRNTDPNIMVKKAKKNALIDAVRTGFALSDFFDDGEGDEGGDAGSNAQAPASSNDKPQRAATPARSANTPGGPAQAPQPAQPPAAPPASAPGPRGGAAPAREPTDKPGLPMNQATGQVKDPSWWRIGKDVPGALWTVLDREDNEYGVQGCIHFPARNTPECGGGQKKWSPFTPNAGGKPEFKTKEPFITWCHLTWLQLLEYAISHRLERDKIEDTNHYSDPFHHLLADKSVCVFNSAVLPIAEHAAALDLVAWGVVQRRGGSIPEWASEALVETRKAAGIPAPEPAPAPAPAPAPPSPPAAEPPNEFIIDEDEVPF